MLKITSEHLALLRDLERHFEDHITNNNYNIVHYARDHIGERNKMLDANRENLHKLKLTVKKFHSNFEFSYTSPEKPSIPYTKEDSEILQNAFSVKKKKIASDTKSIGDLTDNELVLKLCKKEMAEIEFSAHEFKEFIQEKIQ